jgi:DNA-directed RNA polymerase subunit M/transcription elongation factor TFIIS
MASATQSMRESIRNLYESIGLTTLEAQDLEIGVYNSTLEYASTNGIVLSWVSDLFREVYLAKARSLYANVSTKSYINNTKLIERLKEGEFAPHEIANMSNDRMFPEHWKEIVEKELLRSKAAYEVTQAAMTDQIKCGKCKKNKISYYELQIRSSDEPSTHFYRCLACGHRWKH